MDTGTIWHYQWNSYEVTTHQFAAACCALFTRRAIGRVGRPHASCDPFASALRPPQRAVIRCEANLEIADNEFRTSHAAICFYWPKYVDTDLNNPFINPLLLLPIGSVYIWYLRPRVRRASAADAAAVSNWNVVSTYKLFMIGQYLVLIAMSCWCNCNAISLFAFATWLPDIANTLRHVYLFI